MVRTIGCTVLHWKNKIMATRYHLRSSDLTESAVNAEVLLYRYPDIGEGELDTLIETFKNLPLLDFSILAADERLGAKLDEFYEDHGEKLRAPLTGVVWAATAPIFIVILAMIYIFAN